MELTSCFALLLQHKRDKNASYVTAVKQGCKNSWITFYDIHSYSKYTKHDIKVSSYVQAL